MYQKDPPGYIDKDIMNMAFDLVKYFLNTAKIMFLEAKESEEAKEAKNVLTGKTISEKIISMNKRKIKKSVIAKELGVSRQYIYKVLNASKNA